ATLARRPSGIGDDNRPGRLGRRAAGTHLHSLRLRRHARACEPRRSIVRRTGCLGPPSLFEPPLSAWLVGPPAAAGRYLEIVPRVLDAWRRTQRGTASERGGLRRSQIACPPRSRIRHDLETRSVPLRLPLSYAFASG